MLALEGAVPNGWVGSCVCETDDRDLDQMTCYQRIKKKKDKSVAGPIGEGGSLAERVSFVLSLKRQGRNDKTCPVGIKTLRLRLYGMRRAQGHGPTEPVAGRGRRSIMSGA
jgi:hypothetical protein